MVRYAVVLVVLFPTLWISEACVAAPPRMHFADTASGRPFSKDPAVVKFLDRYWLYYSLPPYE